MSSNTLYAILGMLAIEPMNGYTIKQTIDKSIGYFWSESPGQLYPALKKSVAAGYIETADQHGSSRSTVYRINAKGRNELSEWLRQAPKKFTMRNELLFKTFLGNNTDSDVPLNHLHSQLHQMKEKQHIYQQIEENIKEKIVKNIDGAHYWYLCTRYGIQSLTGNIRWCEESIAYLQNLEV